MEAKLICTTYTKEADGRLVFRNDWDEKVFSLIHLNELLFTFDILPVKELPTRLSRVYKGKMSIDNVVVHVRILNEE